jgi:hypothetical protein
LCKKQKEKLSCMKSAILIFLSAALSSCSALYPKGGRFDLEKSSGICKIESISGWKAEIALRPAVEKKISKNEAMSATSSDLDEVIAYFDQSGRLIKVTVFDNSVEQNRSYRARSVNGAISGRAIEIIVK